MPTYQVMKVYAFSSPEGGGNPAGVVLDADSLNEHQMQIIAKQANFSETVFISKSTKADFRLDFFTPIKRIPDCGHATVAAFSVLHKQLPGLSESSKEITTGIRKIFIKENRIFMEQPLAKVTEISEAQSMLNKLFSSTEGLIAVSIARHDVGFLLIEVDTEKTLEKITPNFSSIKDYSEKNDLVGVYLFVKKSNSEVLATTRMFAPAYGVNEETATGMAAGLLASLIFQLEAKSEFIFEQGRYMSPPGPSLIFCQILPKESKVLVGGSATQNIRENFLVDV